MLGRTQFIEPILLKGASCTSKSKLGWLPLHEARSLGNRDVIRMILKYRRLQVFFKKNFFYFIDYLEKILSSSFNIKK